MSVRSTPASALRQLHFTALDRAERDRGRGDPAERRLTAQVARAGIDAWTCAVSSRSARVCWRARETIDSLQRDLQRARDSESSSRELARERHDADTRRVAELERQIGRNEG